MAKSQKLLVNLFDTILFYLWDVTTGGAVTQRETYRGAVLFSEFLLSELERREKLREKGEAATVRRGMAMPDSLINAWAWNILEDCRDGKVPPPRALLDVIYLQLGCTHRSRVRKPPPQQAVRRAQAMVGRGDSLRAIAKELNVNASTVLRWKTEVLDPWDQELYTELRRTTNVEAYYPMSHKIYKAKMGEALRK